MIPINNSDTAWLVVTDYNQDNGEFYEDLREDVYNPEINSWEFEYKFKESNGGSVVGGTMGIVDGISNAVGGDRFGHVGGFIGINVGGWTNNGRKALSELVGGN